MESEKLKQAADRQHAVQRMEELGAYVAKLFVELDAAMEMQNRGLVIGLFVLLTWGLSMVAEGLYPSLWASVNEFLGNVIFWVSIVRTWLFIIPRLVGVIQEIRGCLKVLEIFGFIEPLDGDLRKKIKMAEESFVAKMWDWLKRKAREEAYMPA